MTAEADLIAAIARDPSDDGPRLVLADQLQSRGDARGELIAIGHQLAATPGDAALRAREAELIAIVERGLGLPPRCIVRWDRGFVDTLDLTVVPGAVDPRWLARGALAVVREVWMNATDPDALELDPVLELIADAVPANLHRLHFGPNPEAGRRADPEAALRDNLVYAASALPRLDALSIGPCVGRPGIRPPSLAAILAALPAGRFVALDISYGMGPWTHDPDVFGVLRGWPLERLVMRRNRDRRLAAARPGLAPILDGDAFPRLRHLGLIAPFTAELLAVLPELPVFASLTTLTVDRERMADDERAELARRRDPYARIRFVPPSADADLALATADLLRHELARPTEAAPLYEEALRIDPNRRLARYGLASIHQEAKDYARALDEVDRGIAAEPAWPWFTWLRSRPLQMTGRHDEARACLETAVAADPDRIAWWNHLGVHHAWFGRWEAALAAWDKARRTPTPPWLQRYLAQAFVHLGRGPDALAIAEPVLAADPTDWHFGFLRGLALVATDPAAALEAFRQAARELTRDEHFIRDRSQLGAALALAAMGDADAAVAELDAVVARTWCPAIVAPAWALAGCILRAAGRDAEANVAWERCAFDDDPAAFAARANASRAPDVEHVHAACEVPGAWSRIHCTLVAMVSACLLGDRDRAHARAARLAGIAAPIDLGKTCAGSLTRRWPVWQLLQTARPWLDADDAALLERAYASAGTTA